MGHAVFGLFLLALGGCGGGPSPIPSVPTPTQVPPIVTPPSSNAPPATPPSSTPPPATQPPPPPPTQNFNTAEYRRSTGLSTINALAAYDAGAFGTGIKVGIIDSGIDLTSPEFTGRIDSASRDVVANRSLQDPDGHGTFVASVVGAANNNIGVHGVAFRSTIVAARTDSSCAPSQGCSYNDNDIASGIDLARQTGARVINISLGGSAPSAPVVNAIYRATAAGIVIVFSAGNDFDSTNPAVRAQAVNPDPFPRTLLQDQTRARGLILAAGSIDPATNQISAFSNRAGDQQQFYIAAPGENIPARDLSGNLVLVSGTSFSAPHVAGALALLFEAFPNLTANQAVDLLLSTARDAGAAGIDPIYGHGILDLTRAFQPQGQLSLATTNGQNSPTVNPSTTLLTLGSAFGDGQALRTALQGLVVLDSYKRAFVFNLGDTIRTATQRRPLAERLQTENILSGLTENTSLALQFSGIRSRHFLYEDSKPAASRLEQPITNVRTLAQITLGDGGNAGFAHGYSVASLAQAPLSNTSPLFLTGNNPISDRGIGSFFGWRQGAWDLRVAAGSAVMEDGNNHRSRHTSITAAATREWGRMRINAAVSAGDESGSVLGSFAQDGLGLGRGSQRMMASLGGHWYSDDRWVVEAEGALSLDHVDSRGNALVPSIQGLSTSQWRVALRKESLWGDDSLGLQLSQPMRVERGSASLRLPRSFDYSTENAGIIRQAITLAPTARELDIEVGYHLTTPIGTAQLNMFHRTNPGHRADSTNDMGFALQWSARF